ncbi:MAG TPA: hypothetical protein DCQ30_08755 [Acidimicrobiaceae bacterium]|nr:hypothetical protein [Acidimicrobiaceae bacterium]
MDGKRLSVTGCGAAIRRLALATGIGGLALLGTGASATTAAPAVAHALQLAPAQHLRGISSGHHGGGGGGGGGAAPICWGSSNWSGYAVSTTSPSTLPCVPASGVNYTSVSGSWTVPRVTGSGTAYSAVWAGIDGFTNSSLIQSGTEQDVINGVPHYNAWWEILPAPETPISSITVSPGDSITVTITRGSGGKWTITLTDGTQSFTTQQSYSGPGTSAEWVVEAPTVGGRVATLANYGSTAFDNGTVNGSAVSIPANSGGELVQGSRFFKQVVSIPSEPDGTGDGFASSYGSVQPSPPAS